MLGSRKVLTYFVPLLGSYTSLFLGRSDFGPDSFPLREDGRYHSFLTPNLNRRPPPLPPSLWSPSFVLSRMFMYSLGLTVQSLVGCDINLKSGSERRIIDTPKPFKEFQRLRSKGTEFLVLCRRKLWIHLIILFYFVSYSSRIVSRTIPYL